MSLFSRKETKADPMTEFFRRALEQEQLAIEREKIIADERRKREISEIKADTYKEIVLNKGEKNYYIGENKGVAGEARGSSVGENEGGNTTINN